MRAPRKTWSAPCFLARICAGLGLAVFMMTAFCAKTGAEAETEATDFAPELVVAKARDLSTRPFVPVEEAFPEALRNMSRETWHEIRYNPDKALWADEKLPFQVQFFHPGMLYDKPVTIHVVSEGRTARIPFSTENFDYGSTHNISGQMTPQMDHAGFRVHGYINSSRHVDEIVAFLGASYFRAVAKGQAYGLSARGLAVDTALPDGEEFPYFKEFWIEKPGRKNTSLTVHALLDSKSLTGAYTFVLQPGKATTMDVKATLFLRNQVKKIGLAPLTSMFLFGENTSPRPIDDFRPEVHDSDGLLMAYSTGE